MSCNLIKLLTENRNKTDTPSCHSLAKVNVITTHKQLFIFRLQTSYQRNKLYIFRTHTFSKLTLRMFILMRENSCCNVFGCGRPIWEDEDDSWTSFSDKLSSDKVELPVSNSTSLSPSLSTPKIYKFKDNSLKS